MNRHRELLAVLTVEEVYEWDLEEVATKVFGTTDTRHPIVAEMHRWGKYNVSGPMKVIQLPPHYDFTEYRRTPAETRAELEAYGHGNVVAFQTRNPLHRVHEELTKRAAAEIDGTLLLHPVVGMTKPGDVNHYTRVRTYKTLTENYYDQDRVLLSLLPLAMRMGGPREALWHAIIRRNYGANHFIVGRDHAGPGKDSNGEDVYGPYDAQAMVREHQEEIGVTMVPFKLVVYLPDEDRYEEVDKVPDGTKTAALSGTQVREDYLGQGVPLPSWFTRPRCRNPGRAVPAAAQAGLLRVVHRAKRRGQIRDSVRAHLTAAGKGPPGHRAGRRRGPHAPEQGLGFSKEDRDTNVRRIGFVASEIVRHGGVCICAAISPYEATRDDVRGMVGAENFFEVFVDTPLAVCEERDTKGLYAKARAGEIKGFTGIDDPYEAPDDAEIVLDTTEHTVEQNAHLILQHLMEKGFIRTPQPEMA